MIFYFSIVKIFFLHTEAYQRRDLNAIDKHQPKPKAKAKSKAKAWTEVVYITMTRALPLPLPCCRTHPQLQP